MHSESFIGYPGIRSPNFMRSRAREWAYSGIIFKNDTEIFARSCSINTGSEGILKTGQKFFRINRDTCGSNRSLVI